jgi:hypothetical protein
VERSNEFFGLRHGSRILTHTAAADECS